MGIVYTPDSAEAKERAKWEAQHTVVGPGLRPYVRRPYPAIWYRALRKNGQIEIEETTIVTSDDHALVVQRQGWSATPLEAYAAVEAYELECAKLAAERNFDERRMSPKAQAEAAAAADGHHGHLPSVPETPIPAKPSGWSPARRAAQAARSPKE